MRVPSCFRIKSAVKQVYVLSPFIWIILMDFVLKSTERQWETTGSNGEEILSWIASPALVILFSKDGGSSEDIKSRIAISLQTKIRILEANSNDSGKILHWSMCASKSGWRFAKCFPEKLTTDFFGLFWADWLYFKQ